jgi:hypothetical protein
MNRLLPLAERMLREHGEFYPYGGVMLPDGSMQHFAAWDGEERPKSKELIDLMLARFTEGALQGTYKATAIVYDVLTVPPGASQKTDAIAIRLDHRDDYSVVVMIPYRRTAGQVATGPVFAVKADGPIFPPAASTLPH